MFKVFFPFFLFLNVCVFMIFCLKLFLIINCNLLTSKSPTSLNNTVIKKKVTHFYILEKSQILKKIWNINSLQKLPSDKKVTFSKCIIQPNKKNNWKFPLCLAKYIWGLSVSILCVSILCVKSITWICIQQYFCMFIQYYLQFYHSYE